jgi:peptide/nickel transport system permease protein
MAGYIIKRILMLVPVLIGVSLITFLLLHLTPGDPAQMLLGAYATAERVAELREKLGLNKPLYIQYFDYVKGILKGDLGTSYTTNRPVMEMIVSRFPATFELTIFSMFFAIIIGVIFGVAASLKRNSFLDLSLTTLSVLGMATPAFWLGLLLLFLFGVILNIMPIGGRIDLEVGLKTYTNLYLLDSLISSRNFMAFKNVLQHLILPAFVLAIYPIAEISQLVRTNMIEILNQDYIRTARAKGLPEKQVIFKHAFKNVLIPVVTITGSRLGAQFAGAILVETIFSWPGIGRMAYDAIYARDYPLIQGVVLFIAIIFVIINLVVDIMYVYIDPRIKYT